MTAERSARYVQRLALRTPDASLQTRVRFHVEEALRLVALPGENEGRLYFFRSLRFPVFHPGLRESDWVANCQALLLLQAQSACWTGSAGSAAAHAVYFHDAEEPFELLLQIVATGDADGDWFWQPATGIAAHTTTSRRIELLLEALRARAGSWSGVAPFVTRELEAPQILTLLESLPAATAATWLRSFQNARTSSASPEPDTLATLEGFALAPVVAKFDADDPRVIWLAALHWLAREPWLPESAVPLQAIAEALREIASWSVEAPREALSARSPSPAGEPVLTPATATHIDTQTLDARPGLPRPRHAPQRTHAAGLYFLLWPLHWLGIAEALQDLPDEQRALLVFRILRRLAQAANVDPNDPVLAPFAFERSPANAIERLWALRVRRWCWHTARLPIRQIVQRSGTVSFTRTTLDVTLPLADADVRIRRCGLDLDPGWMPWFGRVVHFHYRMEEA